MGDDWHRRSRSQKLAAVLYPNLTDADTRRQMQTLSNNEGKRSPQQAVASRLAYQSPFRKGAKQ
jgi:hypothetical protein